MLSTGDVQGCLRKLETLLRVIRYPGDVDYSSLSKGDPSAFLPVLSFTLTSFSPPFAEQLVAAGLELTGKTDLRFTDTLYKVLRDIFHYKPVVSKQQFLQWGFSQRKISTTCDIISLVLQRHNQLKKPRVRHPASHRHGRGDAPPPLTSPEPVFVRPLVVNHSQDPSSSSEKPGQEEEICWRYVSYPSPDNHSSCASENETTQPAGGEDDQEDVLHRSEVEGRLSALEARIERLLHGLDSLSILEKQLEKLERHEEEEVITISRESWENLTSRVLLLETKLELSCSCTQSGVPPQCQASATSSPSSSMSDASKEDLSGRLERITNM
ncbi:centrosomal protein of 44 kDa [Aulostomus maculatus]